MLTMSSGFRAGAVNTIFSLFSATAVTLFCLSFWISKNDNSLSLALGGAFFLTKKSYPRIEFINRALDTIITMPAAIK